MSGPSRPLRLLLDQNFPNPPAGIRLDVVDKTVSVEHFSHAFPEYARVSTPDWMVYLLAKSAGFDGVVTSDHSQLNQDEELISLEATGIGLVTWKGGQEDPVVMWGQLLAYMPQIVSRVSAQPNSVVLLPSPRLQQSNFTHAGAEARSRSRTDKLSHSERKSASLALMRTELLARDEQALLEVLDGTP